MFNKKLLNNNGYFNIDNNPINDGHRAYIRIDSIETGSFPVKSDTKLLVMVGPRTSFMLHQKEFTPKRIPVISWDYKYNNASKSSFVFALFKKRIFGGNEEIGEVELKLSGFEKNKVVTQDYYLQTPNNKYYNVKVRISIHCDENGSFPFMAPQDGKLIANPVIIHQKTYSS